MQRYRRTIAPAGLLLLAGACGVPGLTPEGRQQTTHFQTAVPIEAAYARAVTWIDSHGYTIVEGDQPRYLRAERAVPAGEGVEHIYIQTLRLTARSAEVTDGSVQGTTEVRSGGSRRRASQIPPGVAHDTQTLADALIVRRPD
ncbi:MAG: hypothetical protein ABR559_01275 [Gemmatimonadota bacterium]